MDKEYKVFYNNEAASQELLDAIESITVVQEVDHVWEARIKIPVCIDENGSWGKETEPAYADYARVRVEARIGEGEFTALIDGRIMNRQPDYNANPGQSSVTLVVQDDSTKLHRLVKSESFKGQPENSVINALFQSGQLGGNIEIDSDLPAAPDPNAVLIQRGTAMEMLRSMAKRYQNFYAYVLPTAASGKSDGFFKPLTTEVDEALTPLFLEGPNRNMSQFSVQQNASEMATYEGQSLDLRDNTERPGRSAEVTPSEGEAATQGSAEDVRHRRLAPGQGDFVDPQEAADRAAAASSITLSGEGSVLPSCYPSILMPYKRVPIRLSNSRYSASYVIFKVTHTLGRSEYTQSFSVRGDAVSPETSTSASAPAPAAAAGALGATFNIQAGIF
jgi:hypothetical protein